MSLNLVCYRSIFVLALAGPLSFYPLQPARAETAASPSEYDVEAAYLYNFVKFVQWPVNALPPDGEPFCIGVLGEDPFRDGLKSLLNGKTAQGHPVVVEHFDDPAQAAHCQIVFVSLSETAGLPGILQRLSGASTLTVGDAPEFISRGGVVGFQVIGDRVRFNVNVQAAQASHLTLSSELLKVAHVVRGAPPVGRAP